MENKKCKECGRVGQWIKDDDGWLCKCGAWVSDYEVKFNLKESKKNLNIVAECMKREQKIMEKKIKKQLIKELGKLPDNWKLDTDSIEVKKNG